MKMPTEYHQKNKESLLKKSCERFQHLSQKEKKNKKQKYGYERNKYLSEGKEAKMVNIVVSDIEIFQKMKNKGLLSIGKVILK